MAGWYSTWLTRVMRLSEEPLESWEMARECCLQLFGKISHFRRIISQILLKSLLFYCLSQPINKSIAFPDQKTLCPLLVQW